LIMAGAQGDVYGKPVDAACDPDPNSPTSLRWPLSDVMAPAELRERVVGRHIGRVVVLGWRTGPSPPADTHVIARRGTAQAPGSSMSRRRPDDGAVDERGFRC
jgi:hypothetical protein